MTVLLGFVFAQAIISGFIPKVSKPPILANYVMQAVVLCSLNLAACCVLTFLYNKPAEEEPPFLIKVLGIRGLGTLLCRPCCRKKKVTPEETKKEDNKAVNPVDQKSDEKKDEKTAEKPAEIQINPKETENVEKKTEKAAGKKESEKPEEKKAEEPKVKENWHELAAILNIVFTIIYVIAFFVILLIFLFSILLN